MPIIMKILSHKTRFGLQIMRTLSMYIIQTHTHAHTHNF